MNTEMSKQVNVMELINLFKDMEKRGTLLSGKGANSKDCLIQIIGAICQLAFESTDEAIDKMNVSQIIKDKTPIGLDPDKITELLSSMRRFSYPLYSINNGDRIVTFGKVHKLPDEYRLIDLTTGMVSDSWFDTYAETENYITNPKHLYKFLKWHETDVRIITRIL